MRGSRPFGMHTVLEFLTRLVDVVVVFFRTFLDPSAADDFARRQSNRRGGGGPGGPPKPPPGGGGYGRRIAGLNDLRDASGNCAAGGGA